MQFRWSPLIYEKPVCNTVEIILKALIFNEFLKQLSHGKLVEESTFFSDRLILSKDFNLLNIFLQREDLTVSDTYVTKFLWKN